MPTIPLQGEQPRALAVSADGSQVYVAFALSGNETTIIPASTAPPPPAPANPSLPPPPQVASSLTRRMRRGRRALSATGCRITMLP